MTTHRNSPFAGWDIEATVSTGNGNALLLSKDGTWRAGLYNGNRSGQLEQEQSFEDEAEAYAHYSRLARS